MGGTPPEPEAEADGESEEEGEDSGGDLEDEGEDDGAEATSPFILVEDGGDVAIGVADVADMAAAEADGGRLLGGDAS